VVSALSARNKVRRTSVERDRYLMTVVRSAPGLSLYELRKLTKWPTGRVDGSLHRLLNRRRVIIHSLDRNGRHVHLVYPRHKLRNDVIEVPLKSIKVGNPVWKDHAFFYALDNLSFGVTGERFSEWLKSAAFQAKVKPRLLGKLIRVSIPKRFQEFYHLEHNDTTVTVSDNNVLVTITGRVITNDKDVESLPD
jgi:hypothetical protein